MKLTEEEKKARKVARQQEREAAKELARIESENNQKPVKRMVINIEWKKSRTWGNCPRAYAELHFHDGSFHCTEDSYYASGCGYDKESTVIAEIFNDFMKYKLWGKTIEQCRREDYNWREKGGAPYGISAGKYNSSSACTDIEYRYYNGGIGTSCYYAISEFIGGKFSRIASGKTFDVYEYADNE